MLFGRRKGAPPAMTLEGALGPNDRLEAGSAMRVAAPGALCVGADGRLLVSSSKSVLAMRSKFAGELVLCSDAPDVGDESTALAPHSFVILRAVDN